MVSEPAANFRARALRAFSLRRNVRLLFVPPEGRLCALDGLRGLAILWVVFLHTGWFIGWHIPPDKYFEMIFDPELRPIWRGDFAVDIFFVLSGFLIAGMLIDERERTGRLRLALFYGRRLWRLWPALVVAVIANYFIVGDHPKMVWANLLYVVNFVPVLGASMGWTWSLAIEEQFYTLCPWLVHALARLRWQARLGAIGAIVAALSALTAWIVVSHGFHAHDVEILLTRDLGQWAKAYDHLYDKPWVRAGPLLEGVAAAYVFRAPGAMNTLGRSGALGTVGLAVALAVATACTNWPMFVGAPRSLEVAYLALFRTVFGLAVAYVVLIAHSDHPVGRVTGRLLSTRLLYPFAQLAYAAYLLNPLATILTDLWLAPSVLKANVSPYWALLPFNVAGTFAAAAVLHLFVERPFMELRPRGEA